MRRALVGVVIILVFIQVLALWPKPLEHQPAKAEVDPEAVKREVSPEKSYLARGIPRNRIPEYSIEGFDSTSTENGEKQWHIHATRARMFSHEKLMHTLEVQANLFNPDGSLTVIVGKEAKYFMDQRDLEVFGEVVTTFPDGFRVESQYLQYQPAKRRILIPIPHTVKGGGPQADGKELAFESIGLDYDMLSAKAKLLRSARVRMIEPPPTKESTTIVSDTCDIDRTQQRAAFHMFPTRPVKDRFVWVEQPNLSGNGRWATLFYGSGNQVVHDMTLFEDVTVRELADQGKEKGKVLRYGTGGRADFDNRKNIVELTELPQVYQDQDTVTGDLIRIFRDTDMVEVEKSNAFSEGGN